MFLDRFFRPKPATLAGRALYDAAAAQARRPTFYTDMGAPDTLEGRFELYTVHVVLLLNRLQDAGQGGAEVRQAVFDAYVRGLDDALREIGVADTSVGKKMKKLAGAFYGRLRAYEAAFAVLPDDAELRALVGRTLFDDADDARAAGLAAYVLSARQSLTGQSSESLIEGAAPQWSGPA
jgi:cytochrome b pre-mRNA-processing protein 3